MRVKVIGLMMCWSVGTGFAAETNGPAVIPAPAKMERGTGEFEIGVKTRIVVDAASEQTGKYLAEKLKKSTGYKIPVSSKASNREGDIRLTTGGAKAGTNAESYELTVTADSVVIRAPEQAGMFYGAQTFLQLLPNEVFSEKWVKDVKWTAPAVQIEDGPRFKWRGMMLDVSRHFYTKQEVERLLDLLAMHKINTFHWHLVDDQGWRIEIKKYPRLTEVGAWRKAIGFGLDPKASTAYGSDGRYGGFYTQKDIREVVAYATARHITIVPEIEMPGHSSAALAAYPEFSCTGGPFNTDMSGGVFRGVFCPGNDKAFDFVDDILAEVFELFPGKYIHIGGDEVPVDNWLNCPKCQARMKEEGLQKPSELESYFIRRVEKYVNAHHRNLVGWSEIREGGLAQNATVMDWIGGAVEAASAGHDVVMTPLADCYFDHYQSTNHTTEPHAIGGYLPLSQVYAFEPIPEAITEKDRGHILGAQANLWTEYVASMKHVEYMTFPRICALSEVGWSPKEARNLEDFGRRLTAHEVRLDELGVNYRHGTVEDK